MNRRGTSWGVALFLSCLASAHAAVCGGVAATDPAPARWQKWFVASDDLDLGLELLGIDGSRVRVLPDLMGKPAAEGGRMTLAAPWPDRVDWPVYHRADLALQPTPVLYGEADAQGRMQLCRIELRTLTEAYRDRDPSDGKPPPIGAADLQTAQVEQLQRDDQGRATGLQVVSWDTEKNTWEQRGATCAVYGPDGALTELSQRAAGRCDQAAAADDSREVYLHDPQGRLVRSIIGESRMEQNPATGQFGFAGHPLVTVYAPGGQVLATYREDAGGRPYRWPASPLLGEGRDQLEAWVIASADGLQIRWTEDGLPASETPWQVIVVPGSTPKLSDYLFGYPKPLAKGTTRADGRITMDAASRRKVWEALNTPGQIVVFTYRSFRTMALMPAVKDTVFKACLDPAQAGRDVCP